MHWYHYFHIRCNDNGYYIAWLGTKENVFPGHYFATDYNARGFINIHDWQALVNDRFEKAFL